MYISFDSFYSIPEYNKFITTLLEKDIPFKQLISMRAPFKWYIQIASKYAPVFLNYSTLPKGTDKWLLETMMPINPAEAYILRRKPSNIPTDFETFTSPNIFKQLKTEPYCILFKYKNKEQLMHWSSEYGLKFYLLGRHREYNLAFSFQKHTRNFVYSNDILMEKTKMDQYSKPGEFEQELNYKKLIKVKLSSKTIDYPFIENGTYHPLKRVPLKTSSNTDILL
jgi:hypothetical protein